MQAVMTNCVGFLDDLMLTSLSLTEHADVIAAAAVIATCQKLSTEPNANKALLGSIVNTFVRCQRASSQGVTSAGS